MNEEVTHSSFLKISYGFTEISAYLATRPEKAVGEQARWDQATAALEQALRELQVDYQRDEGGGAFYGPKVDFKIQDAIGRAWQLGTVQFDFNLPERFDLNYIGEDGQPHRPYMIHRALMGSMERFFGVLIEHYAGAFPVWLSPVQVAIIPIADRHLEYARNLQAKFKKEGLRVTLDDRAERMNAKIRDAQNQKIPYMLVVGDKEMESDQVALRLRSGENPGAMPVADFINRAKDEIARKA